MKTTITIISLTAVLIGLTLLTQEPARPVAGRGLAGHFKQLDRKGDGRVLSSSATASGCAKWSRPTQTRPRCQNGPDRANVGRACCVSLDGWSGVPFD
jgi:hypothetical protein